MTYDCTADVLEHKRKVKYWASALLHDMEERIECHDDSKLQEPEKSIFNIYTPKLKEVEFGSEEYKEHLKEMGIGLKHHYENNSHHPESFHNGVNDMTLGCIFEMLCDWMAAAEARGKPMDFDYLSKRFGIEPQLLKIIINTLKEMDFFIMSNNCPCTTFVE